MADPNFIIGKNNTLPEIQRQLTYDDGTLLPDLTGATVQFIYRSDAQGAASITRTATIVSATNVIVKYTWVAGDTVTAGNFYFQWKITYGSGAIISVPNLTWALFIVEDGL